MRPLTWMVLGLAVPLLLLSALRTDGNETDAEAPTVPEIMSLSPRECARGLMAVGAMAVNHVSCPPEAGEGVSNW